jgi:hypothetical protein
MPLAFESLSHGAIAFGFFNIESDMLLLEHYFFFATDFCEHIRAMAAMEGGAILERTIPVIHIPSREDIGDLMGPSMGSVSADSSVRFTASFRSRRRRRTSNRTRKG